jgi:hypothetical protein
MSKDNKGHFKKTTSTCGFHYGKFKKTRYDVKKTLTDYNYYLDSATQAADYEISTEFIVEKFFDFGNDIGTALRDISSIDQDK